MSYDEFRISNHLNVWRWRRKISWRCSSTISSKFAFWMRRLRSLPPLFIVVDRWLICVVDLMFETLETSRWIFEYFHLQSSKFRQSRSQKHRVLIGRATAMPNLCNVSMAYRFQTTNSWKHGKSFKQRQPSETIVGSALNRNCFSSIRWVPDQLFGIQMELLSTMRWSIVLNVSIESADFKRQVN